MEKQFKPPKRFKTYQEQIDHVLSKNLIIDDPQKAEHHLKQKSYYSLISGYKEIFKVCKNGNYKDGVKFEDIVNLYEFDEQLRALFLRFILRVEKNIKSVYSYNFCNTFGDARGDYLNVNNYNYTYYQDQVNELIAILGSKTSSENSKYDYVNYYIKTYGTVPLWILVHVLTLGNISKMFECSAQKLQSIICRDFNEACSKAIYPKDMSAMLSVLSKFRNVCAHNERLYNYKTKKSITDLPIHKKFSLKTNGKNDLFAIVICFKYLLDADDWALFKKLLTDDLTLFQNKFEPYFERIQSAMGFPENWEEIVEDKMDDLEKTAGED